ncbi:MAG: UDP-N-acetylglucosamine--N-acetylmuramyl-(pentapeptide) pyrophosphoryl-undecaprenol N-acetylglucosamine transferase [Candidatus Omnitrophica bacterium]|nr:UDP-N-acetylglucosamine--N-acetylmuramyl-(pentapeptide) pyrophosphoryl-undecaprenol N-acetylglucosamine transferase [Candidatus Omnitrophota bacterium]
MKILIVTGASGGHIFPALALIESLKETNSEAQITLVLPKKNALGTVDCRGCRLRYISYSSLKLSLDFKNIRAIFEFFKTCLESIFIFFEFKPDIVAGFGSLASLPIMILSWGLEVKSLIHEQNVLCGRANRFLARFADKIAVSFAETGKYLLAADRKKVTVTGNPLRIQMKRLDKKDALDFFGFKQGIFTVLVAGGSQGSYSINEYFLKAVLEIRDRSPLQVIHICGKKGRQMIEDFYRGLDISARVYDFLGEMQYAYSAAELIVSRCGATTIAEIVSFRLPALLIPYPYAYRHQWHNARVLEDKGAAIVIPEERLKQGDLAKELKKYADDPSRLKALGLAFDAFRAPEAGRLLCDELLSLYQA